MERGPPSADPGAGRSRPRRGAPHFAIPGSPRRAQCSRPGTQASAARGASDGVRDAGRKVPGTERSSPPLPPPPAESFPAVAPVASGPAPQSSPAPGHLLPPPAAGGSRGPQSRGARASLSSGGRKLRFQAGPPPRPPGGPSFSPRQGQRQKGAPNPPPGSLGLPGHVDRAAGVATGRPDCPREPDPKPPPQEGRFPRDGVQPPARGGSAPTTPCALSRAQRARGPWPSRHFPFAVSDPAPGAGVSLGPRLCSSLVRAGRPEPDRCLGGSQPIVLSVSSPSLHSAPQSRDPGDNREAGGLTERPRVPVHLWGAPWVPGSSVAPLHRLDDRS
ncbi:proline-rich protein HaeIII subfamily 1-like [Loxodonta africana]|uniref:proline-rich protein HaeIII subfamily 1-like n=1 Tax=Loxodonta africana TaxID=9785 RepID=UPI0005405D85|nr:proline-rich protein HaeIII subfamily 1-like [Loxodonta africana]